MDFPSLLRSAALALLTLLTCWYSLGVYRKFKENRVAVDLREVFKVRNKVQLCHFWKPVSKVSFFPAESSVPDHVRVRVRAKQRHLKLGSVRQAVSEAEQDLWVRA